MPQCFYAKWKILVFGGAVLLLNYPLHFVAASSRGKDLFKQCAACHGQKAEGMMNLKAPAIAGLPLWYIEAQLTKFKSGARGRHPNDIPGMRMRAMAKTLTQESDLTAVAAYVAGLKRTSAAPTLQGNAEAGKVMYATCLACHGPAAAGTKALGAPPLKGSSDWYLLTQIKNFKAGIRGRDATKDPTGATMSPFAQMLVNDQAIMDVLAYIRTL